jgi:hypothetical protein
LFGKPKRSIAFSLTAKYVQKAMVEYKKYFPEYIEYSLLPEEVAGQVLLLCEGESEFNTGKVIELRKTDHAKSKNIS